MLGACVGQPLSTPLTPSQWSGGCCQYISTWKKNASITTLRALSYSGFKKKKTKWCNEHRSIWHVACYCCTWFDIFCARVALVCSHVVKGNRLYRSTWFSTTEVGVASARESEPTASLETPRHGSEVEKPGVAVSAQAACTPAARNGSPSLAPNICGNRSRNSWRESSLYAACPRYQPIHWWFVIWRSRWFLTEDFSMRQVRFHFLHLL